jgi:hypothetical protein
MKSQPLKTTVVPVVDGDLRYEIGCAQIKLQPRINSVVRISPSTSLAGVAHVFVIAIDTTACDVRLVLRAHGSGDHVDLGSRRRRNE